MSEWRRVALEEVSSCKPEIELAQSPMSLWIELHFALERAYEVAPPKEIVIRQVYAYAFHCLNSTKEELIQAVIYAFFEHLPQHGKVRRDLPNRLEKARRHMEEP